MIARMRNVEPERNHPAVQGGRRAEGREARVVGGSLELRALLVMAFWELYPDSSDIFLADGLDYAMPIA